MHFLGATAVALLSTNLVSAYSDIYARHPYNEVDSAVREAYAGAYAEAYDDILSERDSLFELDIESLGKRSYSVSGVSSTCARCMANGIGADARGFPATMTAEQYSHLDMVGVSCTHSGKCAAGEAQKWKSGQTHPSTGQGTPEKSSSYKGSPQRGSPQRGSPQRGSPAHH
ncbi:hypothetical protein MMC13_000189 [Lambiella insularis]|nr:hypothetical protein [Lambiella insularis]